LQYYRRTEGISNKLRTTIGLEVFKVHHIVVVTVVRLDPFNQCNLTGLLMITKGRPLGSAPRKAQENAPSL
jgi:hypothetical protein